MGRHVQGALQSSGSEEYTLGSLALVGVATELAWAENPGCLLCPSAAVLSDSGVKVFLEHGAFYIHLMLKG